MKQTSTTLPTSLNFELWTQLPKTLPSFFQHLITPYIQTLMAKLLHNLSISHHICYKFGVCLLTTLVCPSTHKSREICFVFLLYNNEPSLWTAWKDLLCAMWNLYHHFVGKLVFFSLLFSFNSQVNDSTCFLFWSLLSSRNAGQCAVRQLIDGGDCDVWPLLEPPFC